MQTFTPTIFRAGSSVVFNSVQENGIARITSKNRPDMVLMLSSEREAMQEKIRQLTDLVKAQ